MLLQIETLEQLEEQAKVIDDFLNITCSENPEECVDRGLDLMAYLARTSKMLADAKYHQDQAVQNSIVAQLKLGVSASILKKLIESTCKRENYLVNWIDRLNSTIVHQLDFMRTVISKAKAEQFASRRIG
ncbi:MAG: hypothetical protein WC389_17010 [Lutibacter sp.]|jgi:hypothetical protein